MMKNLWKMLTALGLIALIALSMTQINLPAAVAQDSAGDVPAQKAVVEVEPELLARFNQEGKSGYLIYFHDKADLSAAYDMDWEARGWYVYNTLTQAADQAQKTSALTSMAECSLQSLLD
jgi:hypothetical protein